MLAGTTGWNSAVIAISIVWLVLFFRRGPGVALGAAVVLSFLFPVWISRDILGQPFSVSTMVAVIGLAGFIAHPKGGIRSPLTALDASLAMLVLIHAFSDVVNDRFSIGLPFRVYGEWAIPYIAGRFAVRDGDDLKAIAPWAAGVVITLSLLGVIEMLTHVNPIEAVFGNRPDGKFRRAAERVYMGYHLKRAFGPVEHPIFFGVLPLILMPWAAPLWKRGDSKGWWLLGTCTCLAAFFGVISSVSRAPLGAFFIVIAVLAALRYRWLAWLLGVAAIAMVAITVLLPDRTSDILGQLVNDEDRRSQMEIDGELVEYSGTKSRILLFRVYGPAMRAGGLLGFGTNATSVFPPHVAPLPDMTRTDNQMQYVDNTFILLTLRFGWLGLAAFLLLLLTLIVTSARLNRFQFMLGYPGWMTGVAVSMIAVMMTVWFSYDYGFGMLWMTGTIAGLAAGTLSARLQGARL